MNGLIPNQSNKYGGLNNLLKSCFFFLGSVRVSYFAAVLHSNFHPIKESVTLFRIYFSGDGV